MYKRNERLNLIRKRVDQYGQVAVKDLAIFLQVTPETCLLYTSPSPRD